MIYTYKYLAHPIEKFNTEIAHFFAQLFIKDLPAFDSKLVRPGFVKVVNESPDRLRKALEKITEDYHALSTNDKDKLKMAFSKNSQISIACKDARISLVKYNEIVDLNFQKTLKDFLTMLWEDYPQNKLIENTYGTVQSHFNAFISPSHQKALVCPFCGLQPLKPHTSINRNAYDHFIPKALYPFVSVDFQNLFPTCHECNSDEKKTTDTLYRNGKRRKALHPYNRKYKYNELSISIDLKEKYSSQNLSTLLEFVDWEYIIKLSGKSDPILNTWDEIYQIKRRYKEYLLTYQKTWFEDIVLKRYREDMKDGISFRRFKEKLMHETKDQIQYPLGMLRYVYFSFLFSLPYFENILNSKT